MLLPIHVISDQILSALQECSRVVLVAPPGAGKSTAVPLMLRQQRWLGNQRILMLEPRRLATRSVATRMAEQLGERIGETVGYRTRLDTKVGPGTRIEVITEGVMVRLLLDDPSLEGVGAIVFDEFHERALGSDTAAALLLEVQDSLRPELRLLFMSATLAEQRLMSWLGDARLIQSPGKSYPVELFYRPVSPRADWLAHLVEIVVAELPTHPGSALVFLPGRPEISAVLQRLKGRLPDGIQVMPLHGGLSPAQQRQAISALPAGQRRLVLSTSLAESAVTLDGVNLVIDAGWQRLPEFDASVGMGRLKTRRVSRASADQRTGRAGRQGPGTCWRLWGSSEVLAEHASPQVANADLAPLVLDLAAWGCRRPAQLEWLDSPPDAHWQQALDILQLLGLLDESGALSELGRACQPLPLHPRLAVMVEAGRRLGCTRLAIKLALLLETPLPGQHSGDVELSSRLRWFERDRDERTVLLRKQYSQLARGLEEDRPDADAWMGDLLLHAFPDRLARRRSGSADRYVLRNGRGVRLPEPVPDPREWLVVADSDGQAREGRIRLAVAVSQEAVMALAETQASWRTQLTWLEGGQQFRIRQQQMLGAVCVAECAAASSPDMALADAVLAHIGACPESLPWTPAIRQWQARVRLMALLEPGEWPDIDDAPLLRDCDQWLRPFLDQALKAHDLGKIPLREALSCLLNYPQQQKLDQWLPEAIVIPSGRRAALDYLAASPPLLSVKLQEMFGLADSPTIAGGRVRVTLALLSPAGRPLAMTSDLSSFWRQGYGEVRKEMRGRYPKHPWPEDPVAAEATARTKPR